MQHFLFFLLKGRKSNKKNENSELSFFIPAVSLLYRCQSQPYAFISKAIGFLNIFPYTTGGSTIPSSGVLAVFRYMMPRRAP